MMTDPEWLLAVRAIHQRNLAVELFVPDQNGELIDAGKARLLRLDERGMLVDRPRSGGGAFVVGSQLHVLVTRGGCRWELRSRVLAHEQFRFNASMSRAALLLVMPDDAKAAQRREFFRAQTDGHLTTAVIQPLDRDGQRMVGQSRSVQVRDLSGGGMAIRLASRLADGLHAADEWLIQLPLPTAAEPLELRAQVVRHDLSHAGWHHMGMHFVFDGEAERRAYVDEICRFTTWRQREQLKRLKRQRVG